MSFLKWIVALAGVVFVGAAQAADKVEVTIGACTFNQSGKVTYACPPNFKDKKVMCIKAPCPQMCSILLPKSVPLKSSCPPGYENSKSGSSCELKNKEEATNEVMPCNNEMGLQCPGGYKMVSEPMKCPPGMMCPAVMTTRCVRSRTGSEKNIQPYTSGDDESSGVR